MMKKSIYSCSKQSFPLIIGYLNGKTEMQDCTILLNLNTIFFPIYLHKKIFTSFDLLNWWSRKLGVTERWVATYECVEYC